MHYLTIDTRFRSPVYVFLDQDPRADGEFPTELVVREVELATATEARQAGYGVGSAAAVGQHPWHPDEYREFGSDGAAGRAGFGLIEPRYIGPSWSAYVRAFRPGARNITARI